MDDRAVSAALGYALSLTIATLLISGVFLGMADYVGDQTERAVRSEFEVVGNRIAADVSAADRLAIAAGGTGDVRISTDLPEFVAGRPYRIDVVDVSGSERYSINLTAADPDVEVVVLIRTRTTLVETSLAGGDITVVYTGSGLEVRRE